MRCYSKEKLTSMSIQRSFTHGLDLPETIFSHSECVSLPFCLFIKIIKHNQPYYGLCWHYLTKSSTPLYWNSRQHYSLIVRKFNTSFTTTSHAAATHWRPWQGKVGCGEEKDIEREEYAGWFYVLYKRCLAGPCAWRRASSITGWFLVGCEKEEHGRQYNTPKAGEEKGGE